MESDPIVDTIGSEHALSAQNRSCQRSGRLRRGVRMTRIVSCLALVLAVGATSVCSARPPDDRSGVAAILGTWTGSSICVGNRPACKNEEVVYRFLAVEGQPQLVRLLADKIIDGK